MTPNKAPQGRYLWVLGWAKWLSSRWHAPRHVLPPRSATCDPPFPATTVEFLSTFVQVYFTPIAILHQKFS